MDGDRLKAFTFTQISRLQVLPKTFTPDPVALKTLQDEDSIWLNAQKSEVVLKVDAAAAGYFKRRKLIGGQVIVKTLEDGGLIVSAQVASPDQILPIVRYWLPHVRVISPESLQTGMEKELRDYLDGTSRQGSTQTKAKT